MTELKEIVLTPSLREFILHWGDLGSQWGVNRSVAQIQALLLVCDKPLNAEDISLLLGIARSNVSNSLKELVNWRLIYRLPIAGDRRDHFVAVTDVWEMVTRIAEGRKMREIDPALAALQKTMSIAVNDQIIAPDVLRRLDDLNQFLVNGNHFFDQMIQLPKQKILLLMKLGSGILKYLPGGKGER